MSTPIRVLHPITRLIIGGAQENTMYTAAMLNKDRYKVDMLSGPQTGSEGSLIQTVRNYGVTLEIMPELVREINPWKDWVAFWKMVRLMRIGGYQIVHTHSSKAGVLGRLAASMAGVPIIVHTVHGWSFHTLMSPIRSWMFIIMERIAAKRTDAMIVVARQDIEKGLMNGIGFPEQYDLIRSAIPLDEFLPDNMNRGAVRKELGIPLNVPVVGNVGRLSRQKNPLDWVRVAGQIAAVIPDCWFLLVGDGPLRAEVETLLLEIGIANRTILTGLRRDVPQMLTAMDIFLLTSLWEGLPRVIPQAMAMRIPVVANRVDGTAEAIDHGITGYLCDPGDFNQIVNYCVKLLQSPNLHREMGESGRDVALKEFDLKVMISQIEGLYEKWISLKSVEHK